MHFQIDETAFENYLTQLENTLNEKVLRAAEILAKTMEENAKKNAPWQDQSGRARNSILGEVESYGYGAFEILLTGDTPYFSYLEFAGEGKFAILWPTVLASADELLYIMQNLFLS